MRRTIPLQALSMVNSAAMIRFACGTCKEKLVVPDRHAGRRGKCPNCASINRVPTVSEFDAPTAPIATATRKAAAAEPRARQRKTVPVDDLRHVPASVAPEARAGPGLIERLLDKVAQKPAPDTDIDVYDVGGIPRTVKVLFVVGILVLVPLAIGAAFVVLILLRVKLGN